MTQLFPFTPDPTAAPPFSFQPTIGGNSWTCNVTYNLWGFSADGVNKRPYLSVFDQNGNLVIFTPMVGSPIGYDISLLPPALGLPSTIVWRPNTGNIEVSP
jgi:hypothetical protein